MKTTGAHNFGDGVHLGRFEAWLRSITRTPQIVSGETLNEIMILTTKNWTRAAKPIRARYINRVLFRISREGIVTIKEIQ